MTDTALGLTDEEFLAKNPDDFLADDIDQETAIEETNEAVENENTSSDQTDEGKKPLQMKLQRVVKHKSKLKLNQLVKK